MPLNIFYFDFQGLESVVDTEMGREEIYQTGDEHSKTFPPDCGQVRQQDTLHVRRQEMDIPGRCFIEVWKSFFSFYM